MEIITVDAPRASILRRKAKPVGRVTAAVVNLIEAMIETMRAANGVGLAAPQVGVGKRLFVAQVEDRVHVVVDPQIIHADGEEVAAEGCLSIPGVVADIPRATHVVVKGKNRRGRGIRLEADGLLARVIQHELDHLDGILFLDRVVDRSTIRQITAAAEEEAAVPAG